MADGSGEFSETSEPGQICAHCHECRPLYEEAVRPTYDALTMRGGVGDGLLAILARDGYNIPNDMRSEINVLMAKLKRVKRIAGYYAQAFQRIEQLGVAIPFPGAAAFAANIVHNELSFANAVYLSMRLADAPQSGSFRGWLREVVRGDMQLLTSIPERIMRGMVRDITYGNLLVFVEVFPIYTFCIKHFERFGVPRGQAAIDEFDQCLRNFITWWDANNFGSGDSAFTIEGEQRIRIDRRGLFGDGIIAGLRGRRAESALAIMENEQRYTLQEYMYDRIDWGVPEIFPGGFEIDDPFYGGAYFRNIALVFSYDLNRSNIEEKYIVPWTGGNVTEAEDRIPFTTNGVNKFIQLYYGADNQYMNSQIGMIKRHVNDT